MKRILFLMVYTLLVQIDVLQGQTFTNKQSKFLKKKAINIQIDPTFSNGDWKPIAKQIGNKRIVLLGEFNHGSKEVFLSRNDLIKYLHENFDFNVILFESGIGELVLPDLQKKEMSPSRMTYGFFGSWRTSEFRDLMKYVKSENISISGYDVQRTGGSFEILLKEVANEMKIDSLLYYDLEKRYGRVNKELTNRKAIYDSVLIKATNLIDDYQKLFERLIGNRSSLFSKEQQFTLRTIVNRMNYLKYRLQFVKDKNWNKRWAARDSALAENIKWLAEEVYPNEKLIIVGHNFHISKFNKNEEVMGEFLQEKYAGEMYSIRFFAAGGTYFNNAGKEQEMTPADSMQLDLKHIISKLEGATHFLHVNKKPREGDEWLRDYILLNDTFIDLSGTDRIILSKHFDGLILLDKVSPPEK